MPATPRYPHRHLRALWRALWPPILHLCADQQPGSGPDHRWGLATLHGHRLCHGTRPNDGVPTAKTQKSRETRLVRRRWACWSHGKVEPSIVSARDVVAQGVSERGGPRTEVAGLVSCPVSILSAISLVSGIRSLTGSEKLENVTLAHKVTFSARDEIASRLVAN